MDFSLFGRILNHSRTDVVFFHWFTPVASTMVLLIFSSIDLLIFQMSDFDGLMSRHVGLLLKFG